MIRSSAKTIEEYLAELPLERREAISKIRAVILKNLPPGYEEGMGYGMMGYFIPFSRFSNTYNGQPLGYIGLASQKHKISLYLNNVYSDPKLDKWFRAEWKKSGKKLDMGKSCVRFKDLDDVPLDLIAKTVAKTPVDEFIRLYKHAQHAK